MEECIKPVQISQYLKDLRLYDENAVKPVRTDQSKATGTETPTSAVKTPSTMKALSPLINTKPGLGRLNKTLQKRERGSEDVMDRHRSDLNYPPLVEKVGEEESPDQTISIAKKFDISALQNVN